MSFLSLFLSISFILYNLFNPHPSAYTLCCRSPDIPHSSSNSLYHYYHTTCIVFLLGIPCTTGNLQVKLLSKGALCDSSILIPKSKFLHIMFSLSLINLNRREDSKSGTNSTDSISGLKNSMWFLLILLDFYLHFLFPSNRFWRDHIAFHSDTTTFCWLII